MTHERPDAENTLAGHVPIELSRLLTFFLQANADNLLTATVIGKRKREVGLAVPAKFTAFTQELKNTNILKRELNERASRYTHLELKNITIDENKFPLLAENRIAVITVYLEVQPLFEGGTYFIIPLCVRCLIKGGVYSSKYGMHKRNLTTLHSFVNTVIFEIIKS